MPPLFRLMSTYPTEGETTEMMGTAGRRLTDPVKIVEAPWDDMKVYSTAAASGASTAAVTRRSTDFFAPGASTKS
jgi:hypothetical protein